MFIKKNGLRWSRALRAHRRFNDRDIGPHWRANCGDFQANVARANHNELCAETKRSRTRSTSAAVRNKNTPSRSAPTSGNSLLRLSPAMREPRRRQLAPAFDTHLAVGAIDPNRARLISSAMRSSRVDGGRTQHQPVDVERSPLRYAFESGGR